MRSEIDEPEIPDGVAVIGSDDAAGTLAMIYFDERVVSRRYVVEVTDGEVAWHCDEAGFAQRMVVTVADGGTRLDAKGTMSRNGGPWEDDLRLTYERIGTNASDGEEPQPDEDLVGASDGRSVDSRRRNSQATPRRWTSCSMIVSSTPADRTGRATRKRMTSRSRDHARRVEEEDLRVLVEGSTGVTWFIGTLAGTFADVDFASRLSFTRTWVHSAPHGWKVVAAHASPTPDRGPDARP